MIPVHVKMHAVKSSNIKAMGYDTKKATLFVTFNSGATYAYLEVPEKVARRMLEADSKGEYFADHIKNAYAFVKE